MTQTVKISIHTEGAINLAEACAGSCAVKRVEVRNTGDEAIEGSRLTVRCQGGELALKSFDMPSLKPGEKTVQSCTSMVPVPSVVAAITVEYETAVIAELFVGNACIGSATQGIIVHPANKWAGFKASKALASFSIPNHPALNKVCARTAEILKERCGSSSLSGYDNPDPSWARRQGEAAYEALREVGLSYALPPCSFGGGQCVRLPHQVLEENKGTCLCLSFTCASQLESIGLDPIVVIFGNHAIAGYYARKSPAAHAINRDKKTLLKLTQGDDPDIVLLECTVLTHSANNHFAQAHEAGKRNLRERDNFEYWLDIKAARAEGAMPLPLLVAPGASADTEESAGEPADDLPFGPQEAPAAAPTENPLDPAGEESADAPEKAPLPHAGAVGRGAPSPALREVLDHQDTLGRNALTGAFMGTPLPRAHHGIPEPAFVDPAGHVAPLSADASQLHAVQRAGEGENFVLIGPPGTGKTQAIANIAADSLAQGKTVAIAARSEKALDVIKSRLERACLGPYCLDLYSKGIAAASAVAQMERAYTFGEDDADALLAQQGFGAAADRDTRTNIEFERSLNAYAQALERTGACNLTLREQICGYQQYRSAPNLVSVDSGFSTEVGTRYTLDDVLGLIDDTCAHVVSMGGVHSHPLFPLENISALDGKDAFAEEANRRAEELANLVDTLRSAKNPAFTPAEARALAESLEGALRHTWVNTRAERDFARAAREATAQQAEADEFARQVEGMWKPSLFELSSDALSAAWESACALPPWRSGAAKRLLCKELQPHALRTVSPDDIPNALGALSFHESASANALEALQGAADTLIALVESELEALRLLSAENEKVHEWSVWLDYKDKAARRGLRSMTAAHERGLPAHDVAASAKKAVFHALCVASIRADSSIRRFSGAVFERTVDEYERADRAMKSRAARTLLRGCRERVAAAIEDARNAQQATAFKEALQSKGRGRSVASMLESFPQIASALCPCVLLTPDSAAEHIAWDTSFDLLVIDEASQMETAHAIGLIERAAQVIVVGDDRQLPPTCFFTRRERADEAGIVARGESILDDCLIAGLPRLTLNRHYRSRHESLIAFANAQFYQNRLITFPSSDDRVSKVILRRVEGPYDGKGCNRAEAQAIVAELKRRFEQDCPAEAPDAAPAEAPEGTAVEEAKGDAEEASASANGRKDDGACEARAESLGCSIGVITFNVKQQALVNSLLSAEFAQNDAFARWAREGRESLFVRNLENVQGDERDTILLSLTYARSADGALSLNFGPVNKVGGERRLNVALTRARCEMQVFTSMGSGDMELTEAHSRGAHVMRDFLAYAEAAASSRRATVPANPLRDDSIADSLCSRLEALGYRTARDVGASQAKVDIAVIDPRNQNRYLAGILLDGASYHLARSAHDREIGRKSQLEDLGWNIMRVWSVDYLFDEDRCVERTAAFLEQFAA